jgi:hypothetical protein
MTLSSLSFVVFVDPHLGKNVVLPFSHNMWSFWTKAVGHYAFFSLTLYLRLICGAHRWEKTKSTY